MGYNIRMIEDQVNGMDPKEAHKDLPTHFIIRLNKEQTRRFIYLINQFGIESILTMSDIFADMIERGQREGIPKDYQSSPEDIELLKFLAEERGKLTVSGLNIQELDLTFRFVGTDSDTSLDQIIEQARIHGGKKPDWPENTTSVHRGYKVTDLIRVYIEFDHESGVLFIYDRSKLRKLTEEEEAKDSNNFAGGFGVAPINGLELKDALLGIVAMDGSN